MPRREIVAENERQLQEVIEKIRRTAKLSSMILLAIQAGRIFAVTLVEKELAQRTNKKCSWPRCWKCGARIENKDQASRQIKTLIGTVHWNRKIGRCPKSCQIEQVVPLDNFLGIEPYQQTSNELKKAACALAVFVPYAIAAVLLKLLTGLEISDSSIWNWVQEVGTKAKNKLQLELDALEQGELPEQEPMSSEIASLPMLIGVDGVNAPFRRNEGTPEGKTKWKEIKIGIIARMKRYTNSKGKQVSKIERKRVTAVVGDIDQIRDRLWLEALKQNIKGAHPVIWLSDGGPGLWRIFRERFSYHAQGILDFFHASQNIWKGARAWLDGRTNNAQQWFTSLRHILRHQQPALVINEITKVLREEDNLSPNAQKTLQNLLVYLGDHYQYLDYPRYEQLGYPLGSGFVESSCKWVVQQRFKCVGMRWSDSGFDNLLHLRIAWINERFDELFL